MANLLKNLATLPSIGLAAGALALLGTALAGSSDLPEQARSLTSPQREADLVAPTPKGTGLSSAVVTRDWVEVVASPHKGHGGDGGGDGGGKGGGKGGKDGRGDDRGGGFEGGDGGRGRR